MIRDSNPDFQISPDLDPDVCRITPRMSWIHHLVRVSHSTEYCAPVWSCCAHSHKSGQCAVELYHAPHLWFHTSPMASSALQLWFMTRIREEEDSAECRENRPVTV